MCIFNGPVAEVSKTQIAVVPVVNGKQLVMYESFALFSLRTLSPGRQLLEQGLAGPQCGPQRYGAARAAAPGLAA